METTIVTLTLTTVVSFLALLVGGMIGWMARQHSYETTPQVVYTHPEMFDENGNVVADEILDLLDDLAKTMGTAILMSTHNFPLIQPRGRQFIELDEGKQVTDAV